MHLQTRHASWEAHVHQLSVEPMLNAYIWHAAGSAAGASKDVTSARGAGCSGCSAAARKGPGYGCCSNCGEASSRNYVRGLCACHYKQICWLKSAGETRLDPSHMLVLGLRSMPPMSVAGCLLPQGTWGTGGTLQTLSKTQQTQSQNPANPVPSPGCRSAYQLHNKVASLLWGLCSLRQTDQHFGLTCCIACCRQTTTWTS